MRIASGLALVALVLGQASPAFAFSKDITVTAVEFSSNFDTATITLSGDPGELVHVAYDLYRGDSLTSNAGGGTNQQGPTVTLSGLSNNFDFFGGEGTRYRLQFRVCPFDEPSTGLHQYQYCSQQFVKYITYEPIEAPPAIMNAMVGNDYDSITVQLSAPMKKGYILYERYGSGNGADYSGLQYRADGKSVVVLAGIYSQFLQSGTSGKQTILLKACAESNAADGSASCGSQYPLTIDLAKSASFLDVDDAHPNAQAIKFVQQQGIVAGYPDGTFRPDNAINRAEFTKLITLFKFGQEMVDKCATFVRFYDLPRDAWYEKYICRAQDSHLIDGYPDGTFRPANSINVAEAAKIIVLADIFGNPNKALPAFSGGAWFEQYIRYLAERNAIPISITKLDENLTRGEMAEIIYRLRAGVTDAPSKTYEELTETLAPEPSTMVQYELIGLPSYSVENYARNIVYRYAITAPSTSGVVIIGQSFTLRGGRWSGPQLGIFSDASFTNQIDTWASDDNWTASDVATLSGSLEVPASETRYLQLTAAVGTPADMGFSVNVKHPLLPEVTLTEAP